jgi:hypothetical protein
MSMQEGGVVEKMLAEPQTTLLLGIANNPIWRFNLRLRRA